MKTAAIANTTLPAIELGCMNLSHAYGVPPSREQAREAGCSMSQLALAWLLAQGDNILPIPGTTSVEHLEENVAAGELALPADIIRRAGELINADTVSGPRYRAATQAEIDTETLPVDATPA